MYNYYYKLKGEEQSKIGYWDYRKIKNGLRPTLLFNVKYAIRFSDGTMINLLDLERAWKERK